MPATAQHAIREGPHVARNVLAALDGKPQTPFAYGQLGMLVSIGRFKAVGEILGIKVSGLLGWFAWRTYYLLRLPTLDRRIRVALDWTLDLVLKHDIVEIGVRRTRAHPGEVPGEASGRAGLDGGAPRGARRARALKTAAQATGGEATRQTGIARRRITGISRSIFVRYPAYTGVALLIVAHASARSAPVGVSARTGITPSVTRSQKFASGVLARL